jgi:hypothetical protein
MHITKNNHIKASEYKTSSAEVQLLGHIFISPLQPMPEIVVVEKTGALRTARVPDCELATLWKKAGFKTAEGFQLRHVWGEAEDMECRVSLYAKTEGRAGSENKYDFPPPPDKCLFFGSCVLVAWDPATNEAMDLDVDAWKGIYEYLFGGFEDLAAEADEEEDDDVDTDEEFERLQQASGVPIERTKDNYLKDGFVVDDDEEISYASSSDGGSWKDGARKTGKRLKPSAGGESSSSSSAKRKKSADNKKTAKAKEPKPKKIKAAKQFKEPKEPKEPKSTRSAKSKSVEAAGAANTDKLYMYLLPGTSPQEPPLQMFAFERDNASLLLTNPRPPELSEVFEQFEDELQEETYD